MLGVEKQHCSSRSSALTPGRLEILSVLDACHISYALQFVFLLGGFSTQRLIKNIAHLEMKWYIL